MKFGIRLCITVVVLSLLLFAIDVQQFVTLLGRVDWWYLGLAFAVVLAIRFVTAFRWFVIADAHDLAATFSRFLKFTFVSNALGFFLPGGVGIDAIRSYQLGHLFNNVAKAASTVILDRIFGIASMLLVALMAAVYTAWIGIQSPTLVFVIMLSIAVLTAGTTLLLSGRMAGLLSYLPAPVAQRINKPLSTVLNTLADKERNLKTVPASAGSSVLVQVMRCVIFYLLFLAFGVDVSLITCLMFVPLVFIVQLLPVTIGGLGVREASVVLLFATVSVAETTSFAVSAVFFALQALATLPGLLIFMFEKRQPKPTHSEPV